MTSPDGYPSAASDVAGRESLLGEQIQDMASRFLTELTQRCQAESGCDEPAAEAKVKELLSSELCRRAAGRSVASPMTDAKKCDDGVIKNLEQERVEVDAELQFTWHRPPMEEVERQAADLDTVRIFLNGCFDLMHVGHFNVIRQAKSTFYQKGYKHVTLVVGIHSDAAITGQKGPPLQSDGERLAVLRSTKWVDEIVEDLPYVSMSVRMADRLHVNFVCHGDDLPVVKGSGGMYSDVIDNDRFQLLKRTEGVSTTQILERLLRQYPGSSDGVLPELASALASTQRLSQFAAPSNPAWPKKGLADASRVVYVDGTFDLLHEGQVTILEEAARLGDFVLVGLHADDVVRQRRGAKPVLSMLERAMGVLSVRWVDDVVLDAPWEVTKELITSMNVSVMVAGKKPPAGEDDAPETETKSRANTDPIKSGKYDVARALGIFRAVESKTCLTVDVLRRRFQARRDQIAQRNSGLFGKEMSYIDKKSFVPEA